MQNYVIWGTGIKAQRNYEILSKTCGFEEINIVGYIDNNPKKWGMEFKGKTIFGPDDLKTKSYDYIDIWVANYRKEIEEQIVCNLDIPVEKLRDVFSVYKKKLSDKYTDADSEVKDILHKINSYSGVTVFYYDENKKQEYYKVFKDEENDFNYIFFEGKRLYLAKTFERYIKIHEDYYIADIWSEQDVNSPHLYQEGDIVVKDGDVLVDAGVCEGNFALHNIDKVKKVYLIECDKDWIDALQLTFAPYKEKVIFCNKFLSEKDTEHTITLDTLIEEPIDFLKMDIEGEEVNALLGGERTLSESKNMKCAICSYHRHGDEEQIRKILTDYGFATEVSKGYMLFIYDLNVLKNPELRRGVVRGKK